MFRNKKVKVHFVGIGGIGMSGIAELLLNLGYRVSGSDLKESEITRRLASLGGAVAIGHRAENVAADVDVVVTSSAVKRNNPEAMAARDRGIPVIPRAEMLAELMRLKEGVAIAGSHGKTTTTSLIATVLAHAGLDPTAVVGGKLNALGSNAKLGKGHLMVVEADESDGSFLRLSPTIAVITNVDPEHLDYYGTVEALQQAFVDFADRVPFYGLAVMCIDHPVVQHLIPRVGKRLVTYGVSHQADWRADEVKLSAFQARFSVLHRGQRLGEVSLKMVGAHNVLNALACCAVAHELGIPFAKTAEALNGFQGVQRRFTVRGEVRGITVVDDYGHHPAEIKATLAGARASFPQRRIVCAFQPHRYTRTRDLLADFATAFNDADALLLTEIYAAGEDPIPGVSGGRLFEAVKACGHRDVAFAERGELARRLRERLREGDLVIALGAGDITHACEELLELLA
ncbi:MAG: UDP-N-acetylmuramate--L-alanine ligase [Deltaproteobacteria bacterium]|nr:MAG: UDP-N-acetylmuramate--L-alanine ligase [Deltaproteobacteria bacterium]